MKCHNLLAWWPKSPSMAGQRVFKKNLEIRRVPFWLLPGWKKKNLSSEKPLDVFGQGVNVLCGKWQGLGTALHPLVTEECSKREWWERHLGTLLKFWVLKPWGKLKSLANNLLLMSKGKYIPVKVYKWLIWLFICLKTRILFLHAFI